MKALGWHFTPWAPKYIEVSTSACRRQKNETDDFSYRRCTPPTLLTPIKRFEAPVRSILICVLPHSADFSLPQSPTTSAFCPS
jgi:hypothetical protein